MVLKIQVYWDVKLCQLVDSLCFGGVCCHHLWSSRLLAAEGGGKTFL